METENSEVTNHTRSTEVVFSNIERATIQTGDTVINQTVVGDGHLTETTDVTVKRLGPLLKNELDRYATKYSGLMVSPVQMPKAITPVELDIASEPSRPDCANTEGHFHRRADFVAAFERPESNINSRDLFRRSREKAEKDANSYVLQAAAKTDYIEKHGNIVAVTGQAGIGKTTFLKHCCRETLSGGMFENFSFLIVIIVRRLSFTGVTSFLKFLLSTSLTTWPHHSESSDRALLEMLEKDRGTVIKIDGLDEAAIQDLSRNVPAVSLFDQADAITFLFNLINGNLLRFAQKIVTCRPAPLYKLLAENRPHFIIQILGLSETSQDDLGRQICGNSYDTIKRTLQNNPTVSAYCYVPVNFVLTVHFLQHNTSEVSFVTITRVLSFNFEKYIRSSHTNGRECTLNKLAKLAFDGFINCKIFFDSNDLRRANLDKATLNAFLHTFVLESVDVRSSIHERDCRCNFSHLIWQEYFAAVQLMIIMTLDEFRTHLPSLKEDRWEVVARFAFGLCNHTVCQELRSVEPRCSKLDWEEKRLQLRLLAQQYMDGVSLSKNPSLRLMQVCNWLSEANDDRMTQHAARSLPDEIALTGSILPGDVTSLLYVMKAVPESSAESCCTPVFSNIACTFARNSLELLANDIDSRNYTVHQFALRNIRVRLKDAQHLAACLPNISSLVIEGCVVDNDIVTLLAQALQNLIIPMRNLNFSHSTIGDVGVEALAPALHCAKQVDLRLCGITHDGAAKLGQELEKLPHPVEKIDFSRNKIGDAGAESLMKSLSKVNQINLWDCDISNKMKERIKRYIREQGFLGEKVNL